jgi:hypothetical protein
MVDSIRFSIYKLGAPSSPHTQNPILISGKILACPIDSYLKRGGRFLQPDSTISMRYYAGIPETLQIVLYLYSNILVCLF